MISNFIGSKETPTGYNNFNNLNVKDSELSSVCVENKLGYYMLMGWKILWIVNVCLITDNWEMTCEVEHTKYSFC